MNGKIRIIIIVKSFKLYLDYQIYCRWFLFHLCILKVQLPSIPRLVCSMDSNTCKSSLSNNFPLFVRLFERYSDWKRIRYNKKIQHIQKQDNAGNTGDLTIWSHSTAYKLPHRVALDRHTSADLHNIWIK